MARVLVCTQSDARRDPRPNRLVRLLQDRHHVVLAGFGGGPEGVEFVDIEPRLRPQQVAANLAFLLGRQYSRYAESKLPHASHESLRAVQPDVVISHDLKILPPLRRVLPEARFIADLREYYPRQLEHSARWRVLYRDFNKWVCRNHLPQLDAWWTIGQGLADEYQREYGVSCRVLPSLPDAMDLAPTPVENMMRVIHHGNATPARRLEIMLAGVALAVGRASLDFMLVPQEQGYLERLRAQANRTRNVRIVNPVPFNLIIPTLHQYDLGLVVIPPTTFNLRHGLGNKFFEFIQARLGLIVGPNADMARYVKEHDIGVVTKGFGSRDIAEAIAGLTPRDVVGFKRNADRAAAILNYGEHNAPLILEDIERVTGH